MINNKPILAISCPVSSRSGYGDHARDLVRSLIEMDKFDIKILDQPWGSCPRNALTTNDKEIYEKILTAPLSIQPDVWIQVTVPNEFQPVGKYNIGITAGIETTIAVADWVEGCNRMDRIIVPSEHSKYSLQSSSYQKKNQQTGEVVHELKINVPIDVLFEGLDTDIWKKTSKIPKKINETINKIPEDFCYLYCGHWLEGILGEDRKDTGMTLRVFLETFKNQSRKNQPALILKTSGAGFSIAEREMIKHKIQEVKNTVQGGNLPNVYLLHGDLEPEELNGLYNHPKVKAMLSFTKGEGFGRPLMEFSNTGKPTVVSNWSGHIDFMSAYGIMLPGELREVHPSALYRGIINEGAKWFTVDYGYASGIIKDIQKNYKKYLEKSRKQTQYIKENFTLSEMTKKFERILECLPEFNKAEEQEKWLKQLEGDMVVNK
jgi:glycosyltransferase involved in cell wall biosynthesis